MERGSDSEQVQAEYRGGCGVDSIEFNNLEASEIPEKAYILENGEEKDFPQDPRAIIPGNQGLRNLSTSEVVDHLVEMLEAFADRLSQEENVEELVRETGESREMVLYDIESIREMANPEMLSDWMMHGQTDLSKYLDSWVEAQNYREAATPLGGGVSINAGHNVAAAVLPEIWRVLSRNSIIHKMPSGDKHTLEVLHQVYNEYDNPVANTCRIAYWPGGSEQLEKALFSLDFVMAWGDDKTINQIRKKISPTTRFIPFHFEFGAYLVDKETQQNYSQELLQQIAKDFSWGDQLLCFSPLIMIIEQTGKTEAFLQDLAETLEKHAEKYPPGQIPEKDKININRTKKIARDTDRLISDWENQTTVTTKQGLEKSDLTEFHSYRFVNAHKVENLEKGLKTVGSIRNLQEFILAVKNQEEVKKKIMKTQAKRITSPGNAQPQKPIPWDGKHPINELLQWITDE
ncbi:MAG: acyl-CoA reductase [Candidatus Nanohalobium sp.]